MKTKPNRKFSTRTVNRRVRILGAVLPAEVRERVKGSRTLDDAALVAASEALSKQAANRLQKQGVKDLSPAEDAAQDVAVVALESELAESVDRTKGNERTLLSTILNRKLWRRTRQKVDLVPRPFAARCGSDDPVVDIAKRELIEAARFCMPLLDARQQRCIASRVGDVFGIKGFGRKRTNAEHIAGTYAFKRLRLMMEQYFLFLQRGIEPRVEDFKAVGLA